MVWSSDRLRGWGGCIVPLDMVYGVGGDGRYTG